MSQTLRPPRIYRPGLRERLVEGFRYGGGVGQWSWLLHRITGLAILAFLIVHIIETFLVVSYPALYDNTVAIYGGTLAGPMFESWGIAGEYAWLRWGFRLAEIALFACVAFHAVNGVRIILFDFWPRAAQYQRQIFWGALVVFFAIMIPVAVVMIWHLFHPPALVVP